MDEGDCHRDPKNYLTSSTLWPPSFLFTIGKEGFGKTLVLPQVLVSRKLRTQCTPLADNTFRVLHTCIRLL